METRDKTIVVDFLDVQFDNGKSDNIILLNLGKLIHGLEMA